MTLGLDVRRILLLAALPLALVAALNGQRGVRPRIAVLSGSRSDGAATDLWMAMLRRRLGAGEVDSVARIRRARTTDEEAWAGLIESEARLWPAAADSLGTLFGLPSLPEIRIVLGNRGAEDAFTHDSTTIGMDLAALQRVYGAAALDINRDRVNRFFRHEYVHTLQKRWLARHPFDARSFLDDAVFDAWAEGLGNYYSLSADWRPAGHTPSPATAAALAELEPILVERFANLACADSASAGRLLKGLSSGPFTKKWGAVPVALWLLAEQMVDSGTLRRFAMGGPPAFWDLAERHIPAPGADSLRDARRRDAGCVGRRHGK
jgi:hypothetical protein